MRVKRMLFAKQATVSGVRKVYPLNSPPGNPHVTIEQTDFKNVGDFVTGDVEFGKLHYTHGDTRVGFTEKNGVWQCDLTTTGFVPTAKKRAIAEAQALVKEFVEKLGGQCGW